jgi:hypothetical protein
MKESAAKVETLDDSHASCQSCFSRCLSRVQQIAYIEK